MQAYICTVCGYLYDNESVEKDKEGNDIPFEALDETWRCPNCGVQANMFQPTTSDRTPNIPTE